VEQVIRWKKGSKSSALTEGGKHTSREEKADTALGQNTLLHREALLVVTTRDTENVTSELVTKEVTLDLLGHTLVIESLAAMAHGRGVCDNTTISRHFNSIYATTEF
jgi:hypothetical protein